MAHALVISGEIEFFAGTRRVVRPLPLMKRRQRRSLQNNNRNPRVINRYIAYLFSNLEFASGMSVASDLTNLTHRASRLQ